MKTDLNGKAVHGFQLQAEIGATSHYVVDDEFHAEGVTQQRLDDGVAAHVPDPNWGKPAEELTLRDEIAQRLQTLDDATKTKTTWDGLTAAQRQEITRQTIQGFVKVVRFVAKRFL